MARVISYIYKGENVLKQIGVTCPISELDRPRIWIDFNEEIECDTFLLSRVDIIGNSSGDDIKLVEGLRISIYDFDLDEKGDSNNILAEGVVTLNTKSLYKEVKWLVKLLLNKKHVKTYWMSDLKERK